MNNMNNLINDVNYICNELEYEVVPYASITSGPFWRAVRVAGRIFKFSNILYFRPLTSDDAIGHSDNELK